MPLRLPLMAMSASVSPVSLVAALRRSLYFFRSRKFRRSIGSTSVASSCRPSGSRKISRRRRAPMRRWCSHFGHTSRLRSSSGRYSGELHLGHFFHKPSGTLLVRSLACTPELLDRILCNQLIGYPYLFLYLFRCSYTLRLPRWDSGVQRATHLSDQLCDIGSDNARILFTARRQLCHTRHQDAAHHRAVGHFRNRPRRGPVLDSEADAHRQCRQGAQLGHFFTHGGRSEERRVG